MSEWVRSQESSQSSLSFYRTACRLRIFRRRRYPVPAGRDRARLLDKRAASASQLLTQHLHVASHLQTTLTYDIVRHDGRHHIRRAVGADSEYFDSSTQHFCFSQRISYDPRRKPGDCLPGEPSQQSAIQRPELTGLASLVTRLTASHYCTSW